MANRTKLMTASAYKLAGKTYGDSTGFVNLLRANDFDDILINPPIPAVTTALALAGTNKLVLPPVDDIQVGWYVSGNDLDGFSIVINVTQVYSTPLGLPFCKCDPNRVLPPSGNRVATVVYISPNLDAPVQIGSPILFSIGVQTVIQLPPLTPGSRGAIV